MISLLKADIGRDEIVELGSHRLWSLWDMLRFHAHNYIRIGQILEEMKVTLAVAVMGRPGGSEHGLQPDQMDKLERAMKILLRVCIDSDLKTSEELIKARLTRPPKTAGELSILDEAVGAELKSRLFLYVPAHRADYYDKQDLLTEKVRAGFPKGTAELRRAANCYALDEFTACVFHCMRALEHGLHALATDVGITWDVQQWYNVINEIESAIRKLGNTLPKGAEKSERLRFLSEAAKEFFYFKDGWRNHVSHNKVTYDEAQALKILEHVTSFIESLSENLSEPF